MEYDHEPHSPSFKLRLKSSICASSCFTSPSEATSSSSTCSSDDESSFHRPALSSRSSWIRSRAHDLPEEIKEKCAAFFSKIGGKASRRSNNTSEFRYDPMSYALNFDDEASRIDEFPLQSFSARLPPSPPPEKRFAPAVSREIAAFS